MDKWKLLKQTLTKALTHSADDKKILFDKNTVLQVLFVMNSLEQEEKGGMRDVDQETGTENA